MQNVLNGLLNRVVCKMTEDWGAMKGLRDEGMEG